jgi:hypothetical protein
MSDWTGNQKSIFATLGASSHAEGDRQAEDYYATEPKAIDLLLKEEVFAQNILEPACGEGHMSERLKHFKYNVTSNDIVDRNYGGIFNFFEMEEWKGDIITNPPYKVAKEFVEHALQIIPQGNKVAMFLKLQFLEGKARKNLFKTHPPHTIYVSSSRLICAKNGDFKSTDSSAVAYAWYIWVKGYKGCTIVKWIN